MPAEDTVEVVARGEAELVVVVASRIFDVPGVALVGPIPAELQTTIGFAAGVGSAAREPGGAGNSAFFHCAGGGRCAEGDGYRTICAIGALTDNIRGN